MPVAWGPVQGRQGLAQAWAQVQPQGLGLQSEGGMQQLQGQGRVQGPGLQGQVLALGHSRHRAQA